MNSVWRALGNQQVVVLAEWENAVHALYPAAPLLDEPAFIAVAVGEEAAGRLVRLAETDLQGLVDEQGAAAGEKIARRRELLAADMAAMQRLLFDQIDRAEAGQLKGFDLEFVGRR